MRRLWYGLARLVYSLPHSGDYDGCDLVVPLGYGLTKTNELPDATRLTLLTAACLADTYHAKIAWSNSNYFGPGCQELENEQKLQILKRLDKSLASPPIVPDTGISNSVSEAREIRDALAFTPKKIMVVLDWPHGRSALKIWEKTFPDSKIVIRNIDSSWDSSHRAVLQRSNFLWLSSCLLRHFALTVMGLDKVAKIQYKID
jgi:hypothetical protein